MMQLQPQHGKSVSIPLIISREVFSALPDLDQIGALALEKVGKVRIIDQDSQNAIR